MNRVNLGHDTSGRPLVVDSRTLAKLRAAEDALAFAFTIVQGSYRGDDGAAASAGTHDRGGVIDLRTWNLPPRIAPQQAVHALRRNGLIAWYRTTAQGFDPHIHAIDYGNPDLSPSAARQVTAWEHGRNGLASNGPDDGPRIPIPKNPPTPKEWTDVATKEELQEAIRSTPITVHTPTGDKEWTLEQVLRNIERQQDVQQKRINRIIRLLKRG